MKRNFSTAILITAYDLGVEAECVLSGQYTVDLGTPASGEYGPPEHYDPGSADGIDFYEVRLVWPDGTKEDLTPKMQRALVEHNDDLRDYLIGEWKAAVGDDENDRADHLYERYRDERMERLRSAA